MQLTKLLFALGALAAACAVSVDAADTETPVCTTQNLKDAQAVINEKLIQTTCTMLSFDSNGAADTSNTTYCSDAACMKAIKKTKKALPKCTYNGEAIRKGTNKLIKVCTKAGITVAPSASSDSDDDGSGSSTTTKPSKTPKATTASPTPSQESGTAIGTPIGSSTGTTIGTPIGSSTGTEIGTPIGGSSSSSSLSGTEALSTTTAPPVTTAAPVASTSTSGVACVTVSAFTAMLATAVWTLYM